MTKVISTNIKNRYGQYFTPKIVVDFMISLTNKDKSDAILEPSSGKGIFLESLKDKGFVDITAYEIDDRICDLSVINESFVTANIKKRFDLIIGNPPYIRWKNLEDELKNELEDDKLWNRYFNSLCDYSYIFILKSIELLEDGGELIFITPEYWLNTKHSITLRNYMVKNGYFEEIIHFNETPIFDKVNVSTVIFKYIKSDDKNLSKIKLTKYFSNKKITKDILNSIKNRVKVNDIAYLDIEQFQEDKRWLLVDDEVKNELKVFENYCLIKEKKATSLFEDSCKLYHTIGDICDIGNGLVSGLDKAFQIRENNLNEYEEKNILKVIKAKDLKPYTYKNITNYIYLNGIKDEYELKDKFPTFYSHLLNFKDNLEKRYNYDRDIPYWEWVFLRNFNLFSKKQDRIFVPCKERISNKNYFRFSFVKEGLYPTQDVTAIFKKDGVKESIYYILALLNDKRVFDWLCNNGVVKGSIVEFSQKPISSIPFRAINWNDEKDILLHDEIARLCKEHIEKDDNKQDLDEKIDLLFEGKKI
jgi:adenine-specific DNA-methyltransferase